MKKMLTIVLFIVLFATLTACAGTTVNLDAPDTAIQFTTPGVNPELDQPAENGRVAGFGTGLWHGLISVVTLFISFSNPAVQMYEVHNNGALYNLGYLIGVVVFLSVVFGFSRGRWRS